MTYEDLSGRPIKPGDFIVYAALWSRSAKLNYGRVVALAERAVNAYLDDGPRMPTIKVVTIDRGWKGAWELQKKGSVITLAFLDRLLVVKESQLPEEAAKMLREATK